MTMEKHLKIKVPGSGWRRKRGVISSCNTTHGTILVSTIIGWVPNNPAIVESRTLDSWAPITFSGDFLFLWFLLARRVLRKKGIKIDESLCLHQQPTSLTPIKPALTPICTGVGIWYATLLNERRRRREELPFETFYFPARSYRRLKRFVCLGALNCVCARARTPRLRRFNWFARKKTGPPWCYSKRFQHCTLCRLSSSSSSSSRVEFSTLRPSRSCGFFLYLKCWPAFGVHHSNNIRRQRIISYSSRGSRGGFTSVNRGEINTR